MDQLVKLEVGDDYFWIRIKEKGLTEVEEGIQDYEGDCRNIEEDMEFKTASVGKTGSEKLPEGSERVTNDALIEEDIGKEKSIMGCQTKEGTTDLSEFQRSGEKVVVSDGDCGLQSWKKRGLG